MRTYTTPAEASAQVRALCKAEGWTTKDISIRCESYSMGSSINAEIKSARVYVPRLREILATVEHIDRCSVTGEILSGGNRYVHVRYSRAAEREIAAPYLAAFNAALARLDELADAGDMNALVRVGDTGISIGFYNGARWELTVYGPERHLGLIGLQPRGRDQIGAAFAFACKAREAVQ